MSFVRLGAPPARTLKKDRPQCGAKTRKGTPCKAPPVWDKAADQPRNGRCKMHGGLSTGQRNGDTRPSRELTVLRDQAKRADKQQRHEVRWQKKLDGWKADALAESAARAEAKRLRKNARARARRREAKPGV